jgi:hypothetical protein
MPGLEDIERADQIVIGLDPGDAVERNASSPGRSRPAAGGFL